MSFSSISCNHFQLVGIGSCSNTKCKNLVNKRLQAWLVFLTNELQLKNLWIETSYFELVLQSAFRCPFVSVAKYHNPFPLHLVHWFVDHSSWQLQRNDPRIDYLQVRSSLVSLDKISKVIFLQNPGNSPLMVSLTTLRPVVHFGIEQFFTSTPSPSQSLLVSSRS